MWCRRDRGSCRGEQDVTTNNLQNWLRRGTNEEERSVWSCTARLAEHGTASARVVAVTGGLALGSQRSHRCKKKTHKKKTYARMVRRGTRDEKRSLKRCRRTKEERRREEKPPAVCKWTPSLRALPFILFCVDVGLSSLIIPSPNTDE